MRAERDREGEGAGEAMRKGRISVDSEQGGDGAAVVEDNEDKQTNNFVMCISRDNGRSIPPCRPCSRTTHIAVDPEKHVKPKTNFSLGGMEISFIPTNQ